MFRIAEINELFIQLKAFLDPQVDANQLTLDNSVQQLRDRAGSSALLGFGIME